jgi:hypothetical protein
MKMTASSKPIRCELTIKNGTIYSLIYRAEGKPIVIDASCRFRRANSGLGFMPH